MTGFSADWLALREPIDHRSRHPGLLARLADAIGARESLRVVDLGAGTGSNLRALAPHLPPPRQTWRLVDHDPALIAAARTRLMDWAEDVREGEGGPTLVRGGHVIEIAFAQADLAGGIDGAGENGTEAPRSPDNEPVETFAALSTDFTGLLSGVRIGVGEARE